MGVCMCLCVVFVTFPLKSDPNVNLVAWTTTPWTLPSNLAACVHPEFVYAKVLGTPATTTRREVVFMCACVHLWAYAGVAMNR